MLFLLNLEFLPITLLVVYVGAIAVLFLFVLMMLNIKIVEMKLSNSYYTPLTLVLALSFILELFVLIRLELLPLTIPLVHSSFVSDFVNVNVGLVEQLLSYINDSNMKLLGEVIFVDYSIQFVLVSYVLLFAMIGSIVLSLQKKFISKQQNVYYQVVRDTNSCLSFYS